MEKVRPETLFESKLLRRTAAGITILSIGALSICYPGGTFARSALIQQPDSSLQKVELEQLTPSLKSTLEPIFRPHPPTPKMLTAEEPISQVEEHRIRHTLSMYQSKGEAIASNHDVLEVFTKIHQLTKEDVRDSLKLYFPIYRIAQQRSGVPWEYLAIIHASETRFSLDPDPGRLGFVGAMQRTRQFYPDTQVSEYASEYNFFENRYQRYFQPVNTNHSTDFKEIIWAGFHIKERSQLLYPHLTPEEAIRQVVLYNYSADGSPRVLLYDQLKQVLMKNNLS